MDTITSMNMSTKTMATDMGTIIIPKRMKYWGWKYQWIESSFLKLQRVKFISSFWKLHIASLHLGHHLSEWYDVQAIIAVIDIFILPYIMLSQIL